MKCRIRWYQSNADVGILHSSSVVWCHMSETRYKYWRIWQHNTQTRLLSDRPLALISGFPRVTRPQMMSGEFRERSVLVVDCMGDRAMRRWERQTGLWNCVVCCCSSRIDREDEQRRKPPESRVVKNSAICHTVKHESHSNTALSNRRVPRYRFNICTWGWSRLSDKLGSCGWYELAFVSMGFKWRWNVHILQANSTDTKPKVSHGPYLTTLSSLIGT